MSKNVAVLIKDKERQYEGLRVSLGLLLEQHKVNMYVLNHKIEESDEFLDNMEFIDEMDGKRFSNVIHNIEKYNFKPVSLNDVARKLKTYEIIIPF